MTYRYLSFVDDVIRDMRREKDQRLERAGRHMKGAIEGQIRTRGLVRSRYLLRSIDWGVDEQGMYAGSKAPHAHLAEFGTQRRYTRGGAYRGIAPAQPFIMPAFSGERQRLMDILGGGRWL